MLTLPEFQEILNECLSDFMSFRDTVDPADINKGGCREFAMTVMNSLPDGQEEVKQVWLDSLNEKAPNHAVLCGFGLYFDSECMEGVERWQDLPLVEKAVQMFPDIFGGLDQEYRDELWGQTI